MRERNKKKQTLTKPVAKPPETCHLGVLSVLGSKTLKKKCKENTLYRKKKYITSKTCLLNVFELLTYQNSKKRAKHPVW